MRPGEARTALLEAAQRLAGTQDGATWQELAEAAQVGWHVARQTVRNMAHAGALVRIGSTKVAGSTQWHALYAPAPQAAGQAG